MAENKEADQIKVSVKNRNKVVIEIPIDLLKHIAENHPDGPILIKNKERMAEYVAKRLVDITNPEDALCLRIDDCFLEAYESAEDTWIKYPDEEYE